MFPDGELTGSGRIITAVQNVGLEVTHEENLRHHYALTLRDWCRNLVDNWDEAVAEVGLATAKVWGLYMAGSRLGFETNVVQLHQVLAVSWTARRRRWTAVASVVDGLIAARRYSALSGQWRDERDRSARVVLCPATFDALGAVSGSSMTPRHHETAVLRCWRLGMAGQQLSGRDVPGGQEQSGSRGG